MKNKENITAPKENYNSLVTERNWVYSFYWEFIFPIKNSKFKKTQRDSGKQYMDKTSLTVIYKL